MRPSHGGLWRRSKIVCVSIPLAAAVLTEACRDQLTNPRAPGVLARAVTGEAARSVDSNGQFVLPQGESGTLPEISADRAKSLAEAMWHDAAPFIQNSIETDRGAPIHSRDLKPCPRAYYVASAYLGVVADLRPVVQKALGPKWLVGMCHGGVEEVVVSVSSFATDAQTDTGRVQLRQPGTANFFTMGVPVGVEIPTPPEQIANLVAEATDRRVTLVPRLIMRPRPTAAVVAVWQVALDAPVTVSGRTSGRSSAHQVIFAGHLDGWSHPALATSLFGAPDDLSDDLNYKDPTKGEQVRIKAIRRGDVPRTMELITVEGR
jgi:hypothetical protein